MKTIRVGIGFDAHRLRRGRKLIMGGVEIKYDRGLEGHSDADVLSHAIMDALLGAVADGDIGMHFPNTDRKWRGANSLDLMKQVQKRLSTKSARVINVDSMVLAEAPKLMPHVPQMRKNIARVLRVPVDCVSIKATTTEKMGAIGRGEGIAVMAVATVEQNSRGQRTKR